MTELPDSRTESPNHAPNRSRSRPWLVGAVIATAIAFAVVAGLLLGLARTPWVESTPAMLELSESSNALKVAVARTPGGPSEWSNWARIIKYLSEEIGRPVSVRYLSEEEIAAEVIAETDVDVAFICAHHYLDLRDDGEIVGLCTPVLGGDTTGSMLLIVRADDPAETFMDLEGSPVSASDKSSLGGYSYLQYLAEQSGVELVDFFTDVRLGDTQEANMRDVLEGLTRATIVNSVQVLAWDMDDFKTIEQSPPVGSPPVVVDEEMSDDLRQEILDVFLGLDPETILPEGTRIEGFEPIDDSDYAFSDELRQACGHHEHP